MKEVSLQLPDGTPTPATDFGSVLPGQTSASRELRLVNTGTEPISGGLFLKVVQNEAYPGTYIVTWNGQTLTDQEVDVMAGQPFAVGAYVVLHESWSTPSGATQTGTDQGTLFWDYYV